MTDTVVSYPAPQLPIGPKREFVDRASLDKAPSPAELHKFVAWLYGQRKNGLSGFTRQSEPASNVQVHISTGDKGKIWEVNLCRSNDGHIVKGTTDQRYFTTIAEAFEFARLCLTARDGGELLIDWYGSPLPEQIGKRKGPAQVYLTDTLYGWDCHIEDETTRFCWARGVNFIEMSEMAWTLALFGDCEVHIGRREGRQ